MILLSHGELHLANRSFSFSSIRFLSSLLRQSIKKMKIEIRNGDFSRTILMIIKHFWIWYYMTRSTVIIRYLRIHNPSIHCKHWYVLSFSVLLVVILYMQELFLVALVGDMLDLSEDALATWPTEWIFLPQAPKIIYQGQTSHSIQAKLYHVLSAKMILIKNQQIRYMNN